MVVYCFKHGKGICTYGGMEDVVESVGLRLLVAEYCLLLTGAAF